MTPYKTPHFISEYATYLHGFVDEKRRCGFKYNGEICELHRFDRFLFANNQRPDNHSEHVIYAWLSKRNNESVKTFSSRNSIYRQFYRYLTKDNRNELLPNPPLAREKIHGSGFTPYIFTHDEMNRMFSVIDNETNQSETFKKCAPLLFRILYSTGLRINEALSLRICDVSLEKGCLIIKESKNDDSRLVPMSPGLLKRIENYILDANNAYESPLFQSATGNNVSDSSAYAWYRWILWRAEIPHYGRGKGPRLHDLRHTFAIHSLQAAIEKGYDPNAFLPLLSVYLGHKNLTATERYLRLTAEAYPKLVADMDKIMDRIIPEVTDYEER